MLKGGFHDARGTENNDEAAPMVKDPVCGMNVDETKTKHSSTFQGETYHFCSAGCKARFDADPAGYAGSGLRGPMPVAVRVP